MTASRAARDDVCGATVAGCNPRRAARRARLGALASAMPEHDAKNRIGIAVPTAKPGIVIDHLNRLCTQALVRPELRDWLALQGLEVIGGSAASFTARIRADHARWGETLRQRGVRPE